MARDQQRAAVAFSFALISVILVVALAGFANSHPTGHHDGIAAVSARFAAIPVARLERSLGRDVSHRLVGGTIAVASAYRVARATANEPQDWKLKKPADALHRTRYRGPPSSGLV